MLLEALFDSPPSNFEYVVVHLAKLLVSDCSYGFAVNQKSRRRAIGKLCSREGSSVGPALECAAASGRLLTFLLDFDEQRNEEDEDEAKFRTDVAATIVQWVEASSPSHHNGLTTKPAGLEAMLAQVQLPA
jgi:hypothetical protein